VVFNLAAGLLYITVTEVPPPVSTTPAFRHHNSPASFPGDIVDLKSFAAKLKQPAPDDTVSQYLLTHLSPETRVFDHDARRYQTPRETVARDDLNHVVQSPLPLRRQAFAGVNSRRKQPICWRKKPQTPDQLRLNRKLLQDAYPVKSRPKSSSCCRRKRNPWITSPCSRAWWWKMARSRSSSADILWLMTASCYGVKLLLFRERGFREEERKSAARNDELSARAGSPPRLSHHSRIPSASSKQCRVSPNAV